MNDKNRVKIHIDTSSNKEILVRIEHGKEVEEILHQLDHNRAQVVLPLLNQLLQTRGLTVHDITEISVDVGPGSYTGVRVGASIANALATYLQVPINDLALGKIVRPIYS